MSDNVTTTEATTAPPAPALSESNWPGDKGAAVAPPTPAADAGGNATKTPADGGAPPAATETDPGEGTGGATGAGDKAGEDGEGSAAVPGGDGAAPGADRDADLGADGKPKADRTLSGRLSARTAERNKAIAERDQLADLLKVAIEKLGPEKPADGSTAAPGATGDQPPAPAAPDPRPRRDQFDDPDAYDEALDGWSARQTRRVVQETIERQERDRQANEQQRQTRERQTQAHAEAVTRWNTEAEKLRADPNFADFDDLLHDQTVPISAPLSAMLLSLDNGPRIFTELARNPKEAERISRMVLDPRAPGFNPNGALFELGKIANGIANKRPARSTAPPPIRPVGNQARAAEKSPDEESMEEYAARRTPTLNAERRASMFGNRRA